MSAACSVKTKGSGLFPYTFTDIHGICGGSCPNLKLFIRIPDNFFMFSTFSLIRSIWSSPNCSTTAFAISQATAASATTLAAGTAQLSERSMLAVNGSFVSMSTLFSGLYKVGIGFITPRTTIGIPVVIPPSNPPSLFVARV